MNALKNGPAPGLKQEKLSCELAWKVSKDAGVSSVFLSGDSRYAVMTAASGAVSLIDAADGAEKYSCEFPGERLIFSAIDDSSREAFVFGRNFVARIDHLGVPCWKTKIQAPIISAALSQYSKNFILCYEGNRFVIADYDAKPRYKGSVESKGPVSSIYCPRNSPNFAAVTLAGDVFYMGPDGSILWQYCISDHLTSVSISRDGSVIFIGSRENKVLCLHSQQRVLFNFALKDPVVCTDISEDGKYFAIGCSDGSVFVLNEAGDTIFHDRPFSTVSKVYLTDSAERILTLSESRDVSMYRICRRKQAEERSRDMASFIEVQGAYREPAPGAAKPVSGGEGIEGFIEL